MHPLAFAEAPAPRATPTPTSSATSIFIQISHEPSRFIKKLGAIWFLRTDGKYGKRNKLKNSKLPTSRSNRSHLMRKLIFTCIAATLVAAPMTTVVKAEDTTIIKRDREGDKTVIKKREELKVLPVPHTEEKTIIKKERD
jgi:hypothetical protein